MSWANIPIYSGPVSGVVRSRETAGTTDDDMWAFRRVSGQDRPDELDPATYDRYQRLSAWLYYQNPLARRLCDLPTDVCLGSGFNIDTDKDSVDSGTDAEEIKSLIQRFRENPRNQFDLRLPGMFTTLSSVHGELFVPVAVSPANGDVAFGRLEFHQVREVRFNPNNRLEATAVIQHAPAGQNPVWWNVIQAEQGAEEAMYPKHPSFDANTKVSAPEQGFDYGGELFYFSANHLGTGRGRTMLEPVQDWLHAYDGFLFNDLRNAAMQTAFLWDVKMTGATEPELKQKAEDIRNNPPRPGEVNVHNEREEWQALSPALNAASHTELGNQIKKIIGLGTGIPPHMIAAGEMVSAGAVGSTDMSILRRFEMRQMLLVHVIRTLINYQLDQKRYAKVLEAKRPYPYRVLPPSLTIGEILGQAEALYNITQSVLDMTARGGIPMAEARRIWYGYGLMEEKMPANLQKQIEQEIKDGVIPDPKEVVGTENDPSKGAPSAGQGDAKRVMRSPATPGRQRGK